MKAARAKQNPKKHKRGASDGQKDPSTWMCEKCYCVGHFEKFCNFTGTPPADWRERLQRHRDERSRIGAKRRARDNARNANARSGHSAMLAGCDSYDEDPNDPSSALPGYGSDQSALLAGLDTTAGAAYPELALLPLFLGMFGFLLVIIAAMLSGSGMSTCVMMTTFLVLAPIIMHFTATPSASM